MYFTCISSELTHGLRKRYHPKKMLIPYARARFAYAQLRYDTALSEYEQEGFSNGSRGINHVLILLQGCLVCTKFFSSTSVEGRV